MASMNHQTHDTLIRAFGPDDYEQMAAVSNAAYSDAKGRPVMPVRAQDMREGDEGRPPFVRFGRWVALTNGKVAKLSIASVANL
jgi:hypothetical protein